MKTNLHRSCRLLLGSLAIAAWAAVGVAQSAAPAVAAEGQPAAARACEAWQRRLVELAFDAACRFPQEPHGKNRARAQMVVVDACFELGWPELALGCGNRVQGWQRGGIYADYAFWTARAGQTAKARDYVALAEGVVKELASDPLAQEWRRDRIAIQIARAYGALGDAEAAAKAVAGVEANSLHAVDAGVAVVAAERVQRLDAAQADAELAAIEAAFDQQSLGQQRNALEVLVQLHARFFARTALSTRIETLLAEVYSKVMPGLRLQALDRLARAAVAHGERARAERLVKAHRAIVEGHRWRPEDRLPQVATQIELQHVLGERDRARADAEAANADWHREREGIVDIWRARALRPLALAFRTLGDLPTAEAVLQVAIEEGMENPNSRPRCDDLVDTCVALVRAGWQPSAKVMERLQEIGKGLGDPW